MLTIDGSLGEGGGQIVRSALCLSMVTGKAFAIEKIRAGREKPGLMRQHLTAVRAAEEICGAKVSGAEAGAKSFSFEPGAVRSGEYSFEIGTAGSTTLVLQTALLPLVLAPGASRVTLTGGTHNPFAPPFDFLDRAYLPLLRRMGARVSARLERAGFYPAGGGRIVVDIEPISSVPHPAASLEDGAPTQHDGQLRGIELLERGELRGRAARATVANLPRKIAEREEAALRKVLGWPGREYEIVELRECAGPGNVVSVELEFEQVTEVFTSFGEVARPAEAVARQAAHAARKYLKVTAPVGPHLTDQLMLPLAIAGGGRYRSTGLTEHARTHIELIGRFLGEVIETRGEEDGSVVVEVRAR